MNDPTSLGTDLFAMELKYESVDANIAGTAQYNGNISQQIWADTTTVRHAYGYTYDQLNQLSIAEYEKYSGSWNQDAGRFNESATYDLNGNILTMIRGGKTGASSYGSMDNITMSYAGNKLIGANDAVSGITGNYQFHENMVASVVEENASTHEYVYNANGSMVEDKNKNIKVRYNYLNLPVSVVWTGTGDSINWTYASGGAKLRKVVYDNGAITKTVDYVSGFIYENNQIKFFANEEGRVKRRYNGAWLFTYDYKDHLGNVRVTYSDSNNDATAEVLEGSTYYPFGMRIEGLSTSSPDNKFTYNGKELEDDHGLNWYHYGARFYDAQIGRWHVVDPVHEYHSPYLYVGNRCTIAKDPDGQDTWLVHGTRSNAVDAFPKPEVWRDALREKGRFVTDFNWSGDNNSTQRTQAAYALANSITGAWMKDKNIKINIVAHSHGGNVAKEAINILADRGIKVDNLIIIATPSRDDYQIKQGASPKMFISYWNKYDMIQPNGGYMGVGGLTGRDGLFEMGPAGRKHQGAINVDATSAIPEESAGGIEAHSYMNTSPAVARDASIRIFGNEEKP